MTTKTGITSLSQGRSDLLKIDPRQLHIKAGWNLRDMSAADTVEHIDMLAQSIAEIGVQVPLRAYWEDGKAWITSGHCRLAGAIKAINVYKAELKTVPVQIEDRYANEADRILGQIVHNSGKPFSQLEQAKVFKKLVDLGWQQGDIAKKIGISASRVSQVLDLLTLPQAVKAMVSAGTVSPTLAVATVSVNGSQAEQVLKAGLESAKADGKSKVTAANLSGDSRKANIRTIIKDCLDSSDVDDDASEFVVIKMPTEKWKLLRDESGW